ncbi:helix-turn-helix transcriptional regulator, partial [Dactylosporangium sp. NPDC051485]|uniref:helix-turn-helix domain-containing protein n=1 Tax=Dactylosporangium sp. NPDC051485 TaxID=3154846 RepID=UPI00344424D4
MPGQPGGRQPATESFGALLTRLRLARGRSQLRLAEMLCAAAGVPTITRHEVSRWERGDRIPGPPWLAWLALVLQVSPTDLERAAARSRRLRTPPPPARTPEPA